VEGELLRKLSLRFPFTRYYNNLSLFQFEIKETHPLVYFWPCKNPSEVQTDKKKKKIKVKEFPYLVKTHSQTMIFSQHKSI